MLLLPVLKSDLEQMVHLTPKGWPDITTNMTIYVNAPFCVPIKVVIDKKIVGVGTTIYHQNTAWLATIIVHPDYRKQGIGLRIVQTQIQAINQIKYPTILLLASPYGESIYKKVGFKTDLDYFFYKGATIPSNYIHDAIIPYEEPYAQHILDLDLKVAGENRHLLLFPHLMDTQLFVQKGRLIGTYFPTVGEGLIIADTPEAGLALMQLKCQQATKVVLPATNKIGIDFLTQNKFTQFFQEPRMYLGKPITWQSEKLYGRIGGNLG